MNPAGNGKLADIISFLDIYESSMTSNKELAFWSSQAETLFRVWFLME